MIMDLKRKEIFTAWIFLMPAIIGFSIFVFIPIIFSFVLSFLRWDLLTPPKFIGLGNFINLITNDQNFYLVLKNTIIYVLGTVPVRIILALLFALILVREIPFRNFFRASIFFPVVVPTVAAAMVWRWIFNADFGLLNDFLYLLGLNNLPNWLASPGWAMVAIIILSIWKDVGFSTVIFIAGLQSIPEEIYEAASIDGASNWKKFWKITIPLLSPTIFFVFVTNIISSFQVFDQAYVLTGGGPGNATNTIVYYIYNNAFQWLKMGYGAAIAWVLFAFIFIITLIQFKIQKRWVYYL